MVKIAFLADWANQIEKKYSLIQKTSVTLTDAKKLTLFWKYKYFASKIGAATASVQILYDTIIYIAP